MTRCVVMMALAAAACGGPKAGGGTFVQQAEIQGSDLVVSRCEVSARNDKLLVGACTVTRERLPIMVQRREPVACVAAPHEQIARGITTAVRAALAGCTTTHAVTGTVRVTIGIDAAGHVTAAVPDHGGVEFTACMTTTLAKASFPASPLGTKLTFSFQAVP